MKQQTRKLFAVLLLWLLTLATANAADTVTYVYTDPQGTPLAEADASGNITATFDYTPYGTTALGTPPNGPGYTGHVNDAETNLVYMQARYYDSATGRFLSVDPVSPSAGNLFAFDRYAYVDNNPIDNTDPTGRQCAQCLYWPKESLEHQVAINADASQKALIVMAIVAPAIPVAGFIGTTSLAVAADSIATGSLASGIMLNGPSVVASGSLLAEGVAAANGIPAPLSGQAAFTEVSFEDKLTTFSAGQIDAKLSSAEAIENLAANGYSKALSKNGAVTIMSNGKQTYRFYPKSTGGGVKGAPKDVPSASLTKEGAKKPITKLRFVEE